MIAATASAATLVACGGATSGTSDTSGTSGEGTADPPRPGAGASTADPGKSDPPAGTTTSTPGVVGETCPSPTPVIVASGGVITRPAGSALRLQLVYQGSSIGVTNARGVDMILYPADGPFEAGKISGYWYETRSGATTTYQQAFQDPTNQEAPGGPNGEGFQNSTIDRCSAKTIQADVPNNPSTTEIIVFGSPYGTQGAAVELARFTVK